MYKSKARVDQQARAILSRLRDDNERRLRGYQLGSLYYQAREYDQAKEYVSLFLTVKENYAPAHKLIAQIYERSSVYEDVKKAISHYKQSYELDESQKQLTLKICSLYLRIDMSPELVCIQREWIEKAKAFHPNDPIIFNLEEKLINQSVKLPAKTLNTSGVVPDMEQLLITNLKSRPADMALRIKLIKCLEVAQKYDSAVQYIREVLELPPYCYNFEWYSYTADVLQSLTEKRDSEDLWCLYLISACCAARLAIKTKSEGIALPLIIRLDKALYRSVSKTGPVSSAVREEITSQMLLITAYLLSRRQGAMDTQLEDILALYVSVFSLRSTDDEQAADQHNQLIDLVTRLRANRLVQSGYMILHYAPEMDRSGWLQKLSKKNFSSEGKQRIFHVLFGAKCDRQGSMFMNEPTLDKVQAVLPSYEELQVHCVAAQRLYPHSLEHQTWLTLRQHDQHNIPQYMFELFTRMEFSSHRIMQADPCDVSHMDLALFVLLTGYCARQRHDNSMSGQSARPADLTSNLCSEDQARWWTAVYEASSRTNLTTGVLKYGRQRMAITRGLQIVRLIDNHGLSVQMLCYIAKLLQSKLEGMKLSTAHQSSELASVTNWTQRYWTEAVKMLYAKQRSHMLPMPRERMFIGYDDDLTPEEVTSLLSEGRLWLALQLYDDEQPDQALSELRDLPQAIASYTAAQIYKSRIHEDTDSAAKQSLIQRYEEYLHLTVDRLSNDRSNPLNAVVEQELESLESNIDNLSFLSANESMLHNGTSNGNSLLGTPISAARLAGHHRSTPLSSSLSSRPLTSTVRTPATSDQDANNSMRVRPSPERLQLQIRSLAKSQDELKATLSEEKEIFADSCKQMVDTVKRVLDTKIDDQYALYREVNKKLNEISSKMTEHQELISNHMHEIRTMIRNEMEEIRTMVRQQGQQQQQAAQPQSAAAAAQTPQLALLQQQMTALSIIVMGQHQALVPQDPALAALQQQANLSGYGSPARGTPPVYPGGTGAVPEYMHLGTYPHIPAAATQTPGSGTGSCRGGGGLTEQEMQAVAVAAAEQGYDDDREYYVDDGGENYYDEYSEQELSSYVGAEGGSTIAYMPKTSGMGMPMPQPGFFTKPDKSQTKIAEPKPAEQGVPPNVVMNKELMNAEAGKKQAQTHSPLVVNVPKSTPGPFPTANNSNNAAVTSPVKQIVPPSPAKSDADYHNDSNNDAHFEPVIDLPPEVEVVTGEEDEAVLFEARAKLFRMVDKEWKERGIGVFKILERNNTPGKCRILMRRDQVHKVCANHAIHHAMSLAPIGDKGNAFVWTATDYAEEPPTNETFTVRFKSPEIAVEFKAAFDIAREKSKGGAVAKRPEKEVKPQADKAPSLWETMKPKKPQWQCLGCLLQHDKEKLKCPVCGQAQPGTTQADTKTTTANPVTTSVFGAKPPAASPLLPTPTVSAESEANSAAQPANLFSTNSDTSSGLFGKPAEAPKTGGLFGATSGAGLFGQPSKPAVTAQSVFGSSAATPQSVFGSFAATPQSVFGGAPKFGSNTGATPGSLFGTTPKSTTEGEKSLFGKPESPATKPSLFGQPPAGGSSEKKEGEGSLLRKLLTDESSKDPTNKPGEKVTMGGFSFTAPPKLDVKPDAKPASELATKSPFASFGGLTPASTAPSTGLFGAKPSATNSPAGFSFTAKTSGLFSSPSVQAAVNTDMKTSSSAPQLGSADSPSKTTPERQTSKDDTSLAVSPSKAGGALDEECQAEFTPVIPLPQLVETVTGEEEEEVMFSERSKLFRMVEMEWKERGVGTIKILRHKSNHTYRLVMRRDQVLKLCANHRLNSAMELVPSGEKAHCWAAADFSENEIRAEMLCARFKTPDIAAQFKEAFEAAVEKCGSTETSPQKPKSPAKVDEAPKSASLSQLFKPKAGEWSCPGCAIRNKPDTNRCPCCSAAKPGTENETSTGAQGGGSLFGSTSAAPPTAASIFGKPAATPPTAASIFGKPSSGGIFGTPPASAAPTASALSLFGSPAPSETNKSVFGSAATPSSGGLFGLKTEPSTSGSLFATQTPSTGQSDLNKPAVKSEETVPQSPGKYVPEEGEGDNLHFDPVIELPDLVDVKTGEEDEDVLYIHKAKLYRFVNGEYKERGLGDVKILKHKTNGKIRLILRRERVHKLACNHHVSSDMQLKCMDNTQGKAWVWYAVDFAEGTQTEEMFAIRFKTKEIADEFKAAFDAARDGTPVPEQQYKTVSTETPTKARSRPPSESHAATPSTSSTSTGKDMPGTPMKKEEATPAVKSLFGKPSTEPQTPASPFGSKPAHQQSAEAAALFGGAAAAVNKSKIPVATGKTAPSTPNTSLFGKPTGQSPASVFGGGASAGGSLFGKPTGLSPASVFGGPQKSLSPFEKMAQQKALFGGTGTTPKSGSLFGATATSITPTSQASSLFGAKPSPQALFGGIGQKGSTYEGMNSASDSPAGQSADSDEVEYISETKPTAEQVQRAEKYKLPRGFYLYEQRKPCRGCIGCPENEDEILDYLFYNKHYNKKTGLSPAPKPKPTSDRDSGSSSGLSAGGFAAFASTSSDFSALSGASSDPNAFKKTQGFKWSGAGATLFGGASGGAGNQGQEDNPEAFEASGDFKPVLEKLPDLIEVKTGEEDEERVFCNRAKLFRFDTATNQWKERGIGEMKLLKHQANGTIRVLLRREQVHKLVCNHLINPDMELKPLQSSETAWCWFSKDHSDPDQQDDRVEQFAVRFKNIPLAQEFKQKFDEAKQFVIDSQKSKRNDLNKQSVAASSSAESVEDNQAPAASVGGATGGTLPAASNVPGGGASSSSGGSMTSLRASGSASGSVGSGSGSVTVEDEDTDDEDYDEDESDDDTIEDGDDDDEPFNVLCSKQITLMEKSQPQAQYQTRGSWKLEIVEENMDIIGGIAIYLFEGEDQKYRQLIFQETPPAIVQGTTCSWQMYDFYAVRPNMRYFQALFDHPDAAKEFSRHILDGIAYAKELQIREVEVISNSTSTFPLELDLSAHSNYH